MRNIPCSLQDKQSISAVPIANRHSSGTRDPTQSNDLSQRDSPCANVHSTALLIPGKPQYNRFAPCANIDPAPTRIPAAFSGRWESVERNAGHHARDGSRGRDVRKAAGSIPKCSRSRSLLSSPASSVSPPVSDASLYAAPRRRRNSPFKWRHPAWAVPTSRQSSTAAESQRNSAIQALSNLIVP